MTVTPASSSTSVTGDFTATANTGDLPYILVTVDKTVSANVPAESTETVNDPAQGSITIYNKQATAQTLIKNTRFQSPDGKIFRVQDSVSIPGGSDSAPGSVQATVYADTGGDQYNIGATHLHRPRPQGLGLVRPGLREIHRSVHRRFSGPRASVSQATRDAQYDKSKPELVKALSDAVAAALKPGYVILPRPLPSSPTCPANDTAGKDNTVNVNLKGTAVAVAFPNQALAKGHRLPHPRQLRRPGHHHL